MISARILERFPLRYFLLTLLIASALLAYLFQGDVSYAQTDSIKTDRTNYPKPPLPALPRAGGKFIDPTFGTEIMRATDDGDGAQGLGTYYSHWPTFNSNNTRLLIRKGDSGEAILKEFDPVNFTLGTGYTTMPYGLPSGGSPSWESATWSNTDPDIIYTFPAYYDGGMKLYSYNVRTRVFTIIKDFSSLSGGKDYLKQMYVSADDDTFCWLQHRSGVNDGAPLYYLVYRRSTDTVMYHRLATDYVGGINEVHVDKSGKWLHIVILQKQADGTSTRFLNLETGQMQALKREVDHPPGHGDLGTGNMAGFDNYTNGISYRNLSDVHSYSQVLTFKSEAGVSDWTNDFHGTMLANDEGWMTIGTYDDPAVTLPETGLFDDEILQVALDGSQRIRRICHTRSKIDNQTATSGYWAMPKPTISKDGRYIAFTSNWEKSGRYDLFIAKVTPPGSASTNPTPSPMPETTPTPTPTPTPTATPIPTPTPTPTPSLVSLSLVSDAHASASGLAASQNNSAQQINLLSTNIQYAYTIFAREAASFNSASKIERALLAALYFSRAAAALSAVNAPSSGAQNRLQIAAAQLELAKNLMQPGTSALTVGETSHASSVTTTPVIGTGDIRSSASFAQAISPGSLGTILGNPTLSPLSSQTAKAAYSTDGALPYELAGVSVTIGGRAAPVIAVSPSQTSFYIPSDVPTGVIEFLITSQDGYVSQGTAHIAPGTAVPAIFTTNGNGTGAALVLNAMTSVQNSFDVTTQVNLSTDKQTRLMIMSTGISAGAANKNTSNDLRSGASTIVNFAESVAVEARTRDGRTFSLPVEYAGASGLLPGLEQVNVRLLAELRGAGDVELTIIVGSERSNTATVSVR